MTKVLPLSRGKDFKLAERNDFSDNEDDLSADEEMRKSLFHGSGNAGGKTIPPGPPEGPPPKKP